MFKACPAGGNILADGSSPLAPAKDAPSSRPGNVYVGACTGFNAFTKTIRKGASSQQLSDRIDTYLHAVPLERILGRL